MFDTPSWQVARDAKRNDQAAILHATQHLLDPLIPFSSATIIPADLPILSCTAGELVLGIRNKEFTALQIMKAHVRSAMRAHENSNCLTEMMFVEALERAKELDRRFAETGELVGKLHGVPISLKDQYNVKGVDSTLGYTSDHQVPAEEDAVLVAMVKKEGGIPFTKTNVPQTLLSFECGNSLFGTTTNPYDKSRTSGGSSGGEACLLASDGSPLGFGTDVGGSLRIPAHFSGCFGLKPTPGRFPGKGVRSSNPGFDAIRSTSGPMGRSMSDLILATQLIIDAPSQDSRLNLEVPIPFRDITLPKKLKFGYYLTDGFCRSSPACERAVLETVAALRKEGHECVEFKPLDPVRALEIFVALTSAGGYETLLAGLRGDPREDSLWLTTLGPSLYWPVRSVATKIIESVVGDAKMAKVIGAARVKSVTETQEWQLKRDLYVAEFKHDVWGSHAFDAIICAPQATPALKCGQTWDLSALAIGTFLYNVVDLPCGVLPVTFVDPIKDVLSEEWRARKGEKGSPLFEGNVYGKKAVYDPSVGAMAGLPVGVQVVAASWEEEKLLKMMQVVDGALGPRGFGPGEFIKRKMKASGGILV